MKLLCWGHLGNIHKADNELVHVSPTRSREFAKAFADEGVDVTAAVYWPQVEQNVTDNLRYLHVDKIDVTEYDAVFCHLVLSIQQIVDLSVGKKITKGTQLYGNDKGRFKAVLEHPRKYIQLDAPRPLYSDTIEDVKIVYSMKCVGVATHNAVPKWKKMYPKSNVEWVNAATIAFRYTEINISPYDETGRPRVLYLGRMNDASHVPPIDKIHNIASLLPEVEFHIVTNKIRDGKSSKVYAINELQSGPNREIRFHHANNLIKLPNVFLHRGCKYDKSFDWMHHADCAIGFAVRPDQDVASCKSWEYYGAGIPAVIEEGTPELWILDRVRCGEMARYGDWQDFAEKIRLILDNKRKYKRRKTREYIAKNHGYDSRAKQWLELMEKYRD